MNFNIRNIRQIAQMEFNKADEECKTQIVSLLHWSLMSITMGMVFWMIRDRLNLSLETPNFRSIAAYTIEGIVCISFNVVFIKVNYTRVIESLDQLKKTRERLDTWF